MKKTLIISTAVILILGTILSLLITKGVIKLNGNLTSNGTTPTVSITPDKTLGRFYIVPTNYMFTEIEKSYIAARNLDSIIIDQGTTEEITKTKVLFPDVIVYSTTGAGAIQLCNNVQLADAPSTATAHYIEPFFLSFEVCTEKHIIANIKVLRCPSNSAECQSLLAKEASIDSTYLYFTLLPEFGLLQRPTVTIEQYPTHYIAIWESKLGTATQSSYSIEILNDKGSRVYATGKIASTVMGDFIVPTSKLPTGTYTTRIKVWYKLGSGSSLQPITYTTSTSINELHTSTNAPLSTKVQQMSWIPDWGMSAGITSVQTNPSKWAVISPVWFNPNKDGTLKSEPTYNSSTLTSLLKKNSIHLVPTISLFDADILKDILNNHMDTHIAAIVKTVVDNNYDGIDLDYESTYKDDTALLITFVTNLATKLHEKGKTLSFTAVPKIDDREIYSFLPQTHQAQDWKAIGAVVDEFRIMAYDFTGQGSSQPGPLSPYIWDEALIQYAVANMQASKVVLALPLYSHAWPKPSGSNLAGSNNDKTLSSGVLKNTISLQHDDIAYVKSHSSDYKETYDVWNKEVKATFTYKGVARVMYYLDKHAVDERLQLARQYGIKGVCYWRIGGEVL